MFCSHILFSIVCCLQELYLKLSSYLHPYHCLFQCCLSKLKLALLRIFLCQYSQRPRPCLFSPLCIYLFGYFCRLSKDCYFFRSYLCISPAYCNVSNCIILFVRDFANL